MTLAQRLLALALLAQVVWTFVVMLRAGAARKKAVEAGAAPPNALLYPYGWPEAAQKISNNMNNQFETPTLFYALVLLALVAHQASLPIAVLAWIYVASRVLHTTEHAGANRLPLRFGAFFGGVLALMAMTVLLVVSVLAAG